MARTHADPALPTSVADAGSSRPRVVPVLVVGVLLAAFARMAVVESYVVPDAPAPAGFEPGERLLVWKAGAEPTAGDVVLVDAGDGGGKERSTTADPGPVGRALGAVAEAFGVRPATHGRLGLVVSSRADGLVLGTDEPREVPPDDVVGVVGLRLWPLDRAGVVTGAGR
jgi:hypothetical protein